MDEEFKMPVPVPIYDSLIKDMNRLDWLESRMKSVQGPDEIVEIEDAVYAGKSLREAIDALREKK